MPSVIIPPTDVSPYTGSGDQVLATNPVFPGIVTVNGAGGIKFSTDTALFRNGAGQITIDHVGGNLPTLLLSENGAAKGGIYTFNGNTFVNSLAGTLALLSNSVTALSFDTSQNATFAAKLNTVASSTSAAGLNLPQGTAPTAPVNGDLWITSGGLYAQVAGATVGPFSAGPGTITLTGNVTGSGAGSIATTIANNVVSNAMLTNVATSTFKGRTTAGAGSPEDLTATQATALLNTFTSVLQGLVPASGGGTSNFLRADGTWAAAGTSFANPTASVGLTAVNGSASTAMRSDAAPAIDQTIVPTWTGIHTHSITLAANTSGDGVVLSNPTAATSGNQSYSPRLKLLGRGWNSSGSASQVAQVTTEVIPLQTAGTIDLQYTQKYSSNNGTEYSLTTAMAYGSGSNLEWANTGFGANHGVNNSGGATAFGAGSYAGQQCVAFGAAANTAGQNRAVAIGRQATCNPGNDAIAIGHGALADGYNIFVAGSTGSAINEVYFGKGRVNSSATAYTIYGTGGSGTNNAGGALKLCAGRSTGNATPATVVIQAGTVGSSGSTLQTATDVATFTTTGVTVATSLSDSIGNVRSIPQNAQTSAYVLAATDNGKHISITTGGVTVNASTLTTGQVVVIFNNSGSAQTITQGASVTMYLGGSGTTGNRTLAGYGVATVLCVGTDTYVITGSGLT